MFYMVLAKEKDKSHDHAQWEKPTRARPMARLGSPNPLFERHLYAQLCSLMLHVPLNPLPPPHLPPIPLNSKERHSRDRDQAEAQERGSRPHGCDHILNKSNTHRPQAASHQVVDGRA